MVHLDPRYSVNEIKWHGQRDTRAHRGWLADRSNARTVAMGRRPVRSELCDLVGIEVPIIQAGMSIFTSPALAAAVCDAGALGSLGAWNRPADQLRRELDELRDLTTHPFAVNHVVPDLNPDAFVVTLERAPAIVSFALDQAGTDLVEQVHDAGSLVMQQITTVDQAKIAVDHGADVIVAQGGEAGGYAGTVSTLSLVPQVVDSVRPVPVVAAGGIADGRGVAAAVALGAAGVNVGSRFLASTESPVGERWKKALVTHPSEDWIQASFVNAMNPNPGTLGYQTRLRLLRTNFVERWEARVDEVEIDPAPVLAELNEAVAAGNREALLVVGGQSAGLIRRVEPAGAIVRALVAETRAALATSALFEL
jgi:nitronate monooxygenase/enoyl-[acyl-carrier protein] reductase II